MNFSVIYVDPSAGVYKSREVGTLLAHHATADDTRYVFTLALIANLIPYLHQEH